MSSFNVGTIEMNLSQESIDKAIEKVEKFRAYVEKACWELVRLLTDMGYDIAQMYAIKLPDIYHSATIASSIHAVYFPEQRCGVIFTDEPMAVYAEYGTGIMGQFAPHEGIAEGESTPPVMQYTAYNGETRTYTKYDTYEHGAKGWQYVDEGGKLKWTNGEFPGAFMYDTLKALKKSAPKWARTFFEEGGGNGL